MAALDSGDLKILEQTRQRLFQLTSSLASLQQNIQRSDPLPPWSSFQTLSLLLSGHLTSLSTHLTTHSNFFAATTAYPLPTFPGRTEEVLLGQLLRKKLEPDVEDWVEKGRAITLGAGVLGNGSSGGDSANVNGGPAATGTTVPESATPSLSRLPLSEGELALLWSWAPIAANEEAKRRDWEDEFTLEERGAGIENVVTGLLRQLDDDEDEDDDDEDDDDDEGGPDEADKDRLEDGSKAGTGQGNGAGTGTAIPTPTNPQSQPQPQAVVEINPAPMEDYWRFLSTGTEPTRPAAALAAAGPGWIGVGVARR
ncbi:MAG: hypothetical protein M1819_003401 [Sarea resinae]|nr:MAG: hypothetical protein M1819_003401 [Sarea resinae]